MSPALTPAMFTVWPCPGVTACAVESSALISKRVVAEDRDPRRIRLLLLGQDQAGDGDPHDQQRPDGDEVAQVLADRAPHGFTGTRSGGPAWRAGAVDVGHGVVRARDVGPVGRRRVGQVGLLALRGLLDVGEVEGAAAEERGRRCQACRRGWCPGPACRRRPTRSGRTGRCRRSPATRPRAGPSSRRTRGSSAGRSRTDR